MAEKNPFTLMQVLAGTLQRRLAQYEALARITDQLVSRRRDERLAGPPVDVVEMAQLAELAAELRRAREGAAADAKATDELLDLLGQREGSTPRQNASARCRLEMPTAELLEALRSMAAAQKRGHLVISYESGSLCLARGVTTVRIPASGTWPLVAKVNPTFVRDIRVRAKLLPDPVVLEGTRSMLHISHYSTPCRWRPHPPEQTERTVP